MPRPQTPLQEVNVVTTEVEIEDALQKLKSMIVELNLQGQVVGREYRSANSDDAAAFIIAARELFSPGPNFIVQGEYIKSGPINEEQIKHYLDERISIDIHPTRRIFFDQKYGQDKWTLAFKRIAFFQSGSTVLVTFIAYTVYVGPKPGTATEQPSN